MQPPLSLIGLLAPHSYKRDIFPLDFAFFYSAVINPISVKIRRGGNLHYPNDIDRSLNEAASDKIRKYRADYNNNPPDYNNNPS